MRGLRWIAVGCFALAMVCYGLAFQPAAPVFLGLAVLAELAGWISLWRAEQSPVPVRQRPREQ